MRILYSYLRPYVGLIFLALFVAAINQIFSLLDPLIFRHVIDDYASKSSQYKSGEFFRGVLSLLALAVCAAFVSRVAKAFQDYYTNVITQRVGAQIYCDGLAHSLELPYAVFEDQRSGETLGKLQKVKTDVERLISACINSLFTTIVGFIFVIIYTFTVHWVFVVVYGLTVPLIAWVSMALSRRIRTVQQEIVKETTALAGATTESLRNIELVRSLGLGEQEIARLNTTTDKILKLELRKVKYIRAVSFVQGTVINFTRTSVLFLMLYFVYLGSLSFGQFFSLYIYSFFLFTPLQELGNIITLFRESEISLENFGAILEIPKEKKPTVPAKLERLHDLAFDNISFSYSSNGRYALENVSFGLKNGETIAFVGPSGSGKTSLVKLLVGLYRPTTGNISYNGFNQEEIDFDDLREQIGFVTQETQLFAGTIRENLLFVNPKATDEECLNVLQRAACQTLLDRAPEGLATIIGEGGVKVSGGERQRLAIARALLRRPSLLIFDEATSALDSITELEITKTVRELSSAAHHMTVLIAHRLSTIMHADRIYVLERGSVVEQGKHEELLQVGGLYCAMWRQQLGEGEKRVNL